MALKEKTPISCKEDLQKIILMMTIADAYWSCFHAWNEEETPPILPTCVPDSDFVVVIIVGDSNDVSAIVVSKSVVIVVIIFVTL